MGFYGDPILNIQDATLFDSTRALFPCEYCWYQRILIYPIAIIATVALLLKDKKVYYYILPFSLLTILVASYHIYIQANPSGIVPCNSLVACDEKQLNYLGFISIPVMSLMYSLLITVLSLIGLKLTRKAN